MSESNPRDKVGYRNPPKHSRWKKGQSGNPNQKRRIRPKKKLSQTIEEMLIKEIDVIENGVRRRATIFEAILLQLLQKANAGQSRALKVLGKYQKFAASRPEYRMKAPAPLFNAERAEQRYRSLMEDRVDSESAEIGEMFASMSHHEQAAFYLKLMDAA